MTGSSDCIDGRPGLGWRRAMWGGAAALLALPAVAMQFTGDVDWGPGDFLVFGSMLLLACGACELAVRLIPARAWRVTAIATIALVFGLVWVELAVGIFR